MKRLSEVCKIVGVTRRTLQEYNRIGLLSPTEITEGGYWLYDDVAISKLSLIQIFVKIGYKRKDIIEKLENPGLDLLEEYQVAITKLTERKNEIDGMINYLRTQMILCNMPEQFLNKIVGLDTEEVLGNKSIKESISADAEKLREIENLDDESVQPFIALGMMITGIVLFRRHEPSSNEVQSYIDGLYNYSLKLIIDKDDDLTDSEKVEILADKYNSELVDTITDILTSYLKEEDAYKSMSENYGDDAVEFASEALIYYKKNHGGTVNE